MTKLFCRLALSIFILLLFCRGIDAQNSLSGTVTDSISKEAIAEVVIGIPQLKLFAISDANGVYKIMHIPSGKFTVQTQFIGYAPVLKQIAVSGDTKLDISLHSSTASLQEVVVTEI